MTESIRGRLTMTLAIAIAAVLTASAVVAHARFRARSYEELDAHLDFEGREMVEVLQRDSSQLGTAASGMRAWFEEIEAAYYYEFVAADGTVVTRSRNLEGKSIPRPAQWIDSDEGFETTLPDGRPGWAVRVPIEPADWKALAPCCDLPQSSEHFRDGGVVFVATARAHVEQVLSELRVALAIGGVATILVAIAAAGVAVRRTLGPLERLSMSAASIEPGDLTARFGTNGAPVELRPIYRRLNELLERVQLAFARERRFNSAVAHELRTPVAELKTICEVDLRYPATAEEHESTVRQAGEIAALMESLIGRLLALRRAEVGAIALQEETVEVEAIVRQSIEQLASVIRERQLSIDVASTPGASLHTDRTLLTAIISNLISNAVHHSPVGGRIRCAVEAESGRLEVSNPAPDLQPEDLPRLFEPFWRKQSARSDDDHMGLGLALSTAFAERLGMKLTATLDRDGWLHLFLETDVRLVSA